MSTTTQARPTEALIATRVAGNARIDLCAHTAGHFSVTTFIGVKRADVWSATYETVDEARAAAEHVRTVFRTYGTDTAIEARRTELEHAHLALLNRRPGVRNRDQLAAVRVELDGLATLADHAVAARLLADFPRSLAA